MTDLPSLAARCEAATGPERARTLPGWCCPYCGEPVGYLGRFWAYLVGVGIHGCDFKLLKTAPPR